MEDEICVNQIFEKVKSYVEDMTRRELAKQHEKLNMKFDNKLMEPIAMSRETGFEVKDFSEQLELLSDDLAKKLKEELSQMHHNLAEGLNSRFRQYEQHQSELEDRVNDLEKKLQETILKLENEILKNRCLIDDLNQQAKRCDANYDNAIASIDDRTDNLQEDVTSRFKQVQENFSVQIENQNRQFQARLMIVEDEIQTVKYQVQAMEREQQRQKQEQQHVALHPKIDIQPITFPPQKAATCAGDERQSSFTWKIDNFAKKVASFGFPQEISSDLCVFPVLGCRMKFVLYLQNNAMFYFAVQYERPYPDDLDPLNYCHKITFNIVNHANKLKNLIRVIEPRFKDKYATERTSKKALDSVDVVSLIPTSDFIKHHAVEIRVVVESLRNALMVQEVFPKDGHLRWTIYSFSSVIEKCYYYGMSLKSPYFYSSEPGYRMQTSLYTSWNRNEKQWYISFAHRFLKGKWDQQLTPNYRHATQITVVNQFAVGSVPPPPPFPGPIIPDVVRREESKMVDDDCFLNFMSVETLRHHGFLKDDTLIVEVIVTPTS